MTVNTKGLSRIEKRKFWFDHINNLRNSGLGRKNYCNQHDLSLRNFENWEVKYRINTKKSGFIPVRIVSQIDNEVKPVLNLRIGQRYTVEITDNFNPDTLDRLLKTLEQY